MIVYAFLASTFIFLVAGIVFVFKGFRSDESEQKVVPISNLQAIEDLKDVPQSEKNVDDRSSLAKHLLDENLANPQTSSDQSALSEQSEHEIIKADQALTSSSKHSAPSLEESSHELSVDNERLHKQINEQKEKLQQSEREMNSFKQSRNAATDEDIDRIKDLENEITIVKQENAHLLQDKHAWDKIKNENQIFIQQLNKSEEKIKQLEEDLTLDRRISEGKLTEARARIEQLQAQTEQSQKASESVISQQLSDSAAVIDDLRQEKKQMVQVHKELDIEVQKLKEMNTHLLEKEKILQYDLTKSRAQALGLEKICEDFKLQINEMSKALEDSKR